MTNAKQFIKQKEETLSLVLGNTSCQEFPLITGYQERDQDTYSFMSFMEEEDSDIFGREFGRKLSGKSESTTIGPHLGQCAEESVERREESGDFFVLEKCSEESQQEEELFIEE